MKCMKIEKYFEDGFRDIKFMSIVNKIQEHMEKEINTTQGKKKIDGLTGAFISIINDVDTLKGKRDIALDFHFTVVEFLNTNKILLKLQEIDFFNPGCISDEILDRISEIKREDKSNFENVMI